MDESRRQTTHQKERTIYGLRRPGTIPIRYVGHTTSCQKRLRQHMSKSHSPDMRKWVSRLKRDGLVAEVVVLAKAFSYREAEFVERCWIRSLSIVFGPLLLNRFYRGDFVRLSSLELSAKLLGRRQRSENWTREWKKRRKRWLAKSRMRKATVEQRLFTHRGKQMLLSGWAKEIGISRERMRQRVAKCRKNAIDLSEAFDTPAGQCMPSFRNPSERYRLRIAERNASMVQDEWFDGQVHVIQRGRDWSDRIHCETFRNVIQAEAQARRGKCRFRILNDHLMFVFQSKDAAK